MILKGMMKQNHCYPQHVQYYDDIYSALDGVDAVVLMTEWNMYRNLDMDLIKEKLNNLCLLICVMFMSPIR